MAYMTRAYARLAVRGLKALDRTIPADVLAYAVDQHGLDPDALPPRFIHPDNARVINSILGAELFDEDELAALGRNFHPAATLDEL